MWRNENRDYGKIIDYDPQWKGPLDIKREQTDFGFLVSFGIYFVLWIGVGIYAISTGEMKNSGNIQDLKMDSNDHPLFHARISTLGYIAFGVFVLGVVLCFIYLILLRHYPKAVVFTAIVVFFLLLLVTIGILSYQLATHKAQNHTVYSLIMAVVVFIVTLILVIIYRIKVVIACGIIKEATKAVWFFPSSFVFPILPFILYGIALSFFGVTLSSLLQNPAVKHQESSLGHIYFFHVVNIFGIFWTFNFICGFSQMVLSGTFATWFWTMNKERVPSHTILKFIKVTTRFHLGTIAFGSLIIAIIQAIKILFKKAASNRARSDGNNIFALLLSCFGGLFGVVENIIEYMNSNAYIMCTVHGTKFYQSAKDAFNLVMRNLMSVIVVTDVTDLIIGLGHFLVIGTSLLGTYFYCNGKVNEDEIPMVMVVTGLLSIIVSCSIFEILRTAVNTIFLCVLEDYERNDGSSEQPYFMPYKMRQLLMQDE